MIQKNKYFFLFSLFLGMGLFAQFSGEQETTVIRINTTDYDGSQIDGLNIEPFLLETLTFDSSVYLPQDEFLYLVDVHEQEIVTIDKLKKAIEYLRAKKAFQEIIISIEPGVVGTHLHFSLKGLWIFSKLRIKGILQDKETVARYYLIQPGEPFDAQKHKHSLQQIKESIKSDGFFDASVRATLYYDYDTRTILVTIILEKNKRFHVGEVNLTLKTQHNETIAQTIKKELLSRFLNPLEKKVYNKQQITKVAREAKNYLMLCGYLNVSIKLNEELDFHQQAVNLHWNVDIHYKKQCTFLGNYFFTQQELLGRILAFGRSAWLVPATILSEEIQQAYHDAGFWNVQINTTEKNNEYCFVIKENKRVVIKEVEIRNTHFAQEAPLVKQCFSKIRNSFFDATVIKESLSSLIEWYQAHGFLSATILGVSYEDMPTKNEYRLIVAINEGEQSLITRVAIPLFPALEKKGPFLKIIKAKKEVPFTFDLLNEQKQWLSNHFHKKGYLYAEVEPVLQIDNLHNVYIQWNINTGEKIHFGKTIITGSSTFPRDIIFQQLAYKQGDVWNQELIKQSFIRLNELQIFSSIQLRPLSDQKQAAERTLILQLQKDDPFEIRLRGGLELQHIREFHTFNGITYKVGGTFIIKNPFNRGDRMRFDADVTKSHYELVGQYRLPYFFNTPIGTLLQGYSIKHDQPGFVGSTNKLYQALQHGFLLGLLKKTNQLDCSINVGFEWMQTNVPDECKIQARCLAHAIDFKPELFERTVPYVFIEPTLFYERVDNKLYPRHGSISLLSAKGMFPIGGSAHTSYFVKLLVEQAFFVPFYQSVFALRVRFGHIFFKTFDTIMPTERFYLGGSRSLRSYNTDLAPPLGCFVDNDCDEQLVPRGGKSMINTNIEIRFPIFKQLDGVFFQDVGTLSSDNFASFNSKDLLAGTGFGLRIHTPVGPLRFDIGFKWRKIYEDEPRYAWTLTFGQAF